MELEKTNRRILEAFQSELRINYMAIGFSFILILCVLLFFKENLDPLYRLTAISIQPFAWVMLVIYLSRVLFIKHAQKDYTQLIDKTRNYGKKLSRYRMPSTLFLISGFLFIIMGAVVFKNDYAVAVGAAIVLSSGMLLILNLVSEWIIRCALGEED